MSPQAINDETYGAIQNNYNVEMSTDTGIGTGTNNTVLRINWIFIVLNEITWCGS